MKVYIETYGCQMNVYDSAMIAGMLRTAGHSIVDRPELADAAIVNTCSVRERAERRVIGRLNHLGGLLPRESVLGVVGCVAQRMGASILQKAPRLDFVAGTDSYERILDLLEAGRTGHARVDVEVDHTETYDDRPAPAEAHICEFVSVMRGCDNYCTYCIVPYVRGRERSRRVQGVVDEVSALVELGTRDVTLVGQNVNSYRDGDTDFAGLMERVQNVPRLARVRFATSHPKDLSDRLIDTIAAGKNVCEHVHLPVQSGSDSILRSMNRGYTRSDYIELVRRIRERIPGVSLTTDVIVGFPGESEEDYAATVALMEELRFDSAFMFRYSVREGTRAAGMEDDVPEGQKIERLERVIELQKTITESINSGLVGSVQEVLVEGPSQRDDSLLFGRTRTWKPVVFEGDTAGAGDLAAVRVKAASAWTLHGVPVRRAGLSESRPTRR